MIRCFLLVALLMALPIGPAVADASGPACVVSGDTLAINGRRSYGRCVGGTPVGLVGIDAPELGQLCGHPSGRQVLCGRAAAAFLLNHVLKQIVTCTGNTRGHDGQLLATCRVGGRDLNALMVAEGWALADRRFTDAYVADEEKAKAAHKGLWGLTFVPPWEWRKSHPSGH